MTLLKFETNSAREVKISVPRKTSVPRTAIVNITFCVKKKRRIPLARMIAPTISAPEPIRNVPHLPARSVPKLSSPELSVRMPTAVTDGAIPSWARYTAPNEP